MAAESFENTYQIYQPLIYNYLVKKVKNREDAEELSQDIFLNCLYNWNRYNENIASMKTWIYHITRNRLKNYYRSQKNNILLYSNSEDEEDSLLSVFEKLICDDFSDYFIEEYDKKNYLEKTMKCLNSRQKQAIILRYFNEQSLEEIALVLGCSQENAGVILHRAIKKMRQEIRVKRYVYEL